MEDCQLCLIRSPPNIQRVLLLLLILLSPGSFSLLDNLFQLVFVIFQTSSIKGAQRNTSTRMYLKLKPQTEGSHQKSLLVATCLAEISLV